MDGAGVRVGREDGRRGGGPGLIDVLDDDEGLGDGLAVVEQDGDPLVHGVRPEQQLALLAQMHLLLHELVLDALQLQRNQDAGDERARP